MALQSATKPFETGAFAGISQAKDATSDGGRERVEMGGTWCKRIE
jgi:hypothetical protein